MVLSTLAQTSRLGQRAVNGGKKKLWFFSNPAIWKQEFSKYLNYTLKFHLTLILFIFFVYVTSKFFVYILELFLLSVIVFIMLGPVYVSFCATVNLFYHQTCYLRVYLSFRCTLILPYFTYFCPVLCETAQLLCFCNDLHHLAPQLENSPTTLLGKMLPEMPLNFHNKMKVLAYFDKKPPTSASRWNPSK